MTCCRRVSRGAPAKRLNAERPVRFADPSRLRSLQSRTVGGKLPINFNVLYRKIEAFAKHLKQFSGGLGILDNPELRRRNNNGNALEADTADQALARQDAT